MGEVSLPRVVTGIVNKAILAISSIYLTLSADHQSMNLEACPLNQVLPLMVTVVLPPREIL